MCILVVNYRADLVELLFNREEQRARPMTPPGLITIERDGQTCMALVAGLDYGYHNDVTRAGTWLGLNRRGVLVALTNRHDGRKASAVSSRGLLVLNCLKYCTDAASVVQYATEHGVEGYDTYNLLVMHEGQIHVVHNQLDNWNTKQLQPGIHSLSNLNVDDDNDKRVRHVLTWLDKEDFLVKAQKMFESEDILRDRPERGWGTVSSTTLRITGKTVELWQARVLPGKVMGEWNDYSHLGEGFLL